jgi:S-adenosylmethionine hydrolase
VSSKPILTLTTDFGGDGPYVASLKGIILSLAPETQLVDVSHSIAPQNVMEGAFVLAAIVDSFPAGTVHLAVIDPGVGTDRRLVALKVAEQWFVAPDNGLLGGLVRRHRPMGIWEITNPAIRRAVVSHTFHGRDILAPAAAHLLLGRQPQELGPPRRAVITLANFDPRSEEKCIVGEVVFRDTFGNLITNVSAEMLAEREVHRWVTEIAGERITGVVRAYGDRPPGTLVALAGSSGWMEIAIVNGDAARQLTVGPGTTVWFRVE